MLPHRRVADGVCLWCISYESHAESCIWMRRRIERYLHLLAIQSLWCVVLPLCMRCMQLEHNCISQITHQRLWSNCLVSIDELFAVLVNRVCARAQLYGYPLHVIKCRFWLRKFLRTSLATAATSTKRCILWAVINLQHFLNWHTQRQHQRTSRTQPYAIYFCLFIFIERTR